MTHRHRHSLLHRLRPARRPLLHPPLHQQMQNCNLKPVLLELGASSVIFLEIVRESVTLLFFSFEKIGVGTIQSFLKHLVPLLFDACIDQCVD
jgi:hypothetical protein